jgi:hypothetical protein
LNDLTTERRAPILRVIKEFVTALLEPRLIVSNHPDEDDERPERPA